MPSSVAPWLSAIGLLLAGIGAVQATREYRRKARRMDEQFAAMQQALAELMKLPPVPGSQRFRHDPVLRRAVEEQLTDLARRASTDRKARLALEQLVTDELVILDQRDEELRGLAVPSPEDRDELAAIPPRRALLTQLLPDPARH